MVASFRFLRLFDLVNFNRGCVLEEGRPGGERQKTLEAGIRGARICVYIDVKAICFACLRALVMTVFDFNEFASVGIC